MCDPMILPLCPMAIYIGIPADRLVSDPRLCASIFVMTAVLNIKLNIRTPSNDKTDGHPSAGCNTNACEIPHMVV